MIPAAVIIPLLISDDTNLADAILTENDLPIMDEYDDPLLVEDPGSGT